MCIIAPSLLEADYQCLGDQLKIIEEAGAEYVHIDVMDGNFVPNLSFGMKMIRGLRDASRLVFDVHMMVQEPSRFVERFYEAGANVITVHYEACKNVPATLRQIKQLGLRTGIVLNPGTPTMVLTDEIIKLADVIQIMTVEPGVEGQHFIQSCLKKIQEVKTRIDQVGMKRDIEVDGNINFENLKEVLDAGANIIVSGKALFNGNLAQNIVSMKKISETGA